jgi:hypothetical protein
MIKIKTFIVKRKKSRRAGKGKGEEDGGKTKAKKIKEVMEPKRINQGTLN